MKLLCTIPEGLSKRLDELACSIVKALAAHDKLLPFSDLAGARMWVRNALDSPDLDATLDAVPPTRVEVRYQRVLILTIKPAS